MGGTHRPVIGLTIQTLETAGGELPAHCWIMSYRYVAVLAAAGGLPWMVPLLPDDEATLRAMYERMDGLCLPGGVDIDPETYGESALASCDHSDPDRDRTELLLIRWALEDGKPILGLCRGAQIIHIALGGTLYQDIASQLTGALKHDYFPKDGHARDERVHEVTVMEGTRLAGILAADRVVVNSMHHQGLRPPTPGLVVSAVSSDGMIEGIERPGDAFVVGVQWHPEDLADRDDGMRRLFTAFMEASLAWRERRLADEMLA